MMDQSKPRIFYLITRFLKGGAERVITDVVLNLKGYEFTVGYGATYDQSQVDLLKNNGIETQQFPLIRHYNPVTTVPAVVSVYHHLHEEEYDAVHTHSTEAGIIGRFAAAAAGVPHIVHTVHGIPFTEDRNTVLNRFILECERQAAKYTDRIAVNAEVIAEEYLDRRIGSSELYKTVYIGIEYGKFQKKQCVTDLPGSRPRIVMVSRLAKGKGFDVLLDAIELLNNSEVTVCLVGDGPQYNLIKDKIDSRELTDCVFLLGFREDIPQILQASDIFVLPSFREGTPRVIFEAMASGLPVIATDVAGIPEQINDGESGYLIQPGDPKALAERLDELLSNPSCRSKMGEKASKRAERFSIESMTEDFDQLYEELFRNDSTSPE